MGASVPIFQLVSRAHGVPISVLYGTNTAGAALGVLFVTFVLLPRLGVAQTCWTVASLNLLVFCITLLRWPFRESQAHARAIPADREPRQELGFRLALWIVLGTGLATFGLEVAWFRALRAAFWSTSATFAIILVSVLVPMALGARLVPWMRRREISPGTVLCGAGVAILLATPFIERMDLYIAVSGSFSVILTKWLLLSMSIVGIPILLLSMALPWCLEQFPSASASGRLYGLNPLGAVLGALGAAWLLGAWVLVLGLLVTNGTARWLPGLAGTAALGLAVLFSSSPGRHRYQGLRDLHGYTIVGLHEGPDATVTVAERPGGLRTLLIDGFQAADEHGTDAHYMRWMGTLPMLLHEDPKHGLVICFGTGSTADALRHEAPEALDVVEVNAAVLEMAPLFARNHAVLEDPRVDAIHMDGRAWLRRTSTRYDVVTLEPMPPNFAGVNSLYSREFYEIVRGRLEPGGIVAQWLPVHLVSPHHAASIAATFRAVFPDSVLWMDPLGGTGILLGRAENSPVPLGRKWPGLAGKRSRHTLSAEQIRAALFLDAAALARYARPGDVITDDNQLLAFGQIEAGSRGTSRPGLDRQNHRALRRAAGREALRLDPRAFD
jgi:spermidine synthase